MVPVRLHGRRWRTFLVGGGLVLAIGCIAGTQARALDQTGLAAAQPSRDHHTNAPIPGNTVSGATAPGCNSKATDPDRDKEPAHKNWEVIWSAITAIATGILTLATIALGFFTYKLWRETRKAVGETAISLAHAETAATAATRQASISEQALISSNRPHIVIEPNLRDRLPFSDDDSFFNFDFHIHNKGASLAIMKESWKNVAYSVSGASEELMVGIMIWDHYDFLEPGNHKKDKITVAVPAADLWAAVRTEATYLYAYGGFTYESLSGRMHETRFCWRYEPLSRQFREVRDNDQMNFRT